MCSEQLSCLPRLPNIPQEADINHAVHGKAADGTVWQHKKRKTEVTRPNPNASQIHRPVSGFASSLSGDMEHPAPAPSNRYAAESVGCSSTINQLVPFDAIPSPWPFGHLGSIQNPRQLRRTLYTRSLEGPAVAGPYFQRRGRSRSQEATIPQPLSDPTASGSLNTSALSDDYAAFQSGLSGIGTGAHCPRPRAIRPLPLLRLPCWMPRRASSTIPEPFQGVAEDRVAPRLSSRGGCQSGH